MKREEQELTSSRRLGLCRQVLGVEQGASLVFMAFTLMMLLGFAGVAVDGGNAYYQQQRLQIAADAAVLSGARLLATGASHDAVGAEITTIAVKNSADSVDWAFINDGKGVAVVAMRDVDTFFARLYGFDTFSVNAEAEAQYEPVQKTNDLFPLTVGCDCVWDEPLTLVGEDPEEETAALPSDGDSGGTGQETVDVGVDDNKDTTYSITYVGHTDNVWTYEVEEVTGRDLASWGLNIGSCLSGAEVVNSNPTATVIDADSIEWDVDSGFSSGTFTFELGDTYPPDIVEATVTTVKDKSTTAAIVGPDCSSGPVSDDGAADPVASMCLPTIDFEIGDDGISLVSGQTIDDEYEGWGVHVTTHDPVNHPAMIFDSNNPTGGDWDLGSANEDFGGPGRGEGGRAGAPGENGQALGKLLILSEDGDWSDPDDNANGGTMSFTFDVPVHVDDIHLVDVDDLDAVGQFKAYSTQDTSNLITMGQSLALGDNSVQVIPLNAAGVRRLDITLPESGGIQSIVSCRGNSDVLRTIGDLIWADTNNNGVQDSSEVGIPGVELELYLFDENHVIATTTTDLEGEYAFRNLPPGGSAIYEVKVADSNFAPGGLLAGVPFSKQDMGGDEAVDSDFASSNRRATVTIGEEGGDNFDIDGGFFVDIDDLPTEVTLSIPEDNADVLTGQDCAADVAGFDLNCTANDVSLFGASKIDILDDGCVSRDDTVTFQAEFEVVLTAEARYDLGIWFAEDGDPNGDGAVTGTCTVATPAYAPDSPWLDLDGESGGVQDTCGDIDDGHNPLFPIITLTVKCIDPDDDGKLNLPYLTSWRIPGANELCTSPLGAFPGTPSKCRSDTGFEVDIDVPPDGTTTSTDQECTFFRWLDWDGGSSSNLELKQDMELPSRSGPWQITDVIPDGPDMSTSVLLQAGLASQMGESVVIPLSDASGSGNGVCGFVEVKLVSYTSSGGKQFLTIEFLEDVIRSLGTDDNLPDYGARDVVILK